MKKLLFILLLPFISNLNFAQAPVTVTKSLNGYDILTAKDMIAPFNSLGHERPQKTSVWFDKAMVKNMITLLNSEKTSQFPVDGVRIYFAVDNNGDETIVLVSTYDSRTTNNESYEDADYHYDYWQHSSSAPLFNMSTSISGQTRHDDCKGGALLYKRSGLNDDISCDMNNPHYLSRSLCEDMVIGFNEQSININTRSEWFDLEMINGFLKTFENSNVDGIRIYFAQNPINNPYTDYGGMDTFVIVPTTGSTTDSDFHKDYFDCSVASDYFLRSINLLKSPLNMRLQNYFVAKSTKKVSTAISKNSHNKKIVQSTQKLMFTGPYGGQDNGQLCPFNCN